MQSHPHSLTELILATDGTVLDPAATPCPILAAVKARAKAMRKWRKQERLRFFSGWCAGLHALGFSF